MFVDKIKLKLFNKKWRNLNPCNYTFPVSVFDEKLVSVGNYTYGPLKLVVSNNYSRLQIGAFCSIANDVEFILSGEHNLRTLSTFPFKDRILNQGLEALSKGNIIIDDDVWIGAHALILSGVHIGQGAVIGAGSVVTKDVPPYAIVGGNPAKIIRYRFKDEICNYLENNFKYDKLNYKVINIHQDDLYLDIANFTIQKLEKFISNLLNE